jgi:hypothetical protein
MKYIANLILLAVGFSLNAWAQNGPGLPPAVHGSGTANVIPLWQSGMTIGNSSVSQSGNNINVNGSVTATSFFGDGSGLTNLSPGSFLAGGTANINITGNAATATNATELNGLPSGAFAQTGSSNTFNGDQAINGNLTVTGTLGIGGDTPMHSNPHMVLSGFSAGSFCEDLTCGQTNTLGGAAPAGFFVPDKDVEFTRVTVLVETPVDPSCGAQPSFRITKPNPSPGPFITLYTLPLVPSGNIEFDSGPISLQIAAGTQITYGFTNSGLCNIGSSGGGNGAVNIQYVMK